MEPQTCPVCGRVYERKRYYDAAGRFKGYARKSATCSRSCANRAKGGGPVERFWSHVDKIGGPDACWPWMLTKVSTKPGQDYGRVGWEGKLELAHRVAYLLTHGRWPDGDTRHTCDNPPCCNPAHLIDGTTQANVLDMFAKGRKRHPKTGQVMSSLTDEDVCTIRGMIAVGIPQDAIALYFNVSQPTVSRVNHRQGRFDIICSDD
jgi:hypothetical protein